MYKALVIGTSYGGLEALKTILPYFPKDFPLAVLIVLHIGDNGNDHFVNHLNNYCNLIVKEAEDKEMIKAGVVYFAPSNYHLIVDGNSQVALSVDSKIHHSRPSIDVLFESAAWHYQEKLIGVLLTGLNQDGASGLKEIQEFGGATIVENPNSAMASIMPAAAIKLIKPNFILEIDQVANEIIKLIQQTKTLS